MPDIAARGMSPAWKLLCDAVGGRRELAAIFDVDITTLHRWARGATRPPRLVREAVNRTCDEHGVERVFVEEEENECND